MTPKEKALELLDKFRNEFIWVEKDHNVDLYRDSKQCALIAVDEIIKALRKDLPEIGLGKGYWYSVKQEIEKL